MKIKSTVTTIMVGFTVIAFLALSAMYIDYMKDGDLDPPQEHIHHE